MQSIGSLKRVAITCISEIGWHDTKVMLEDTRRAGGDDVSQWKVSWTESNSAGYSALIEAEETNGKKHAFLLDAGWGVDYMEQRLEATGVAERLSRGEIESLIFSHEDNDHFWGLEAVLKRCPMLPIYIPSTFQPEALALIAGADLGACGARNRVAHQGPLHQQKPGSLTPLFPGCAIATFDVAIPGGTRGEQSLIFNLEKHGILLATGCCHQGLPRLLKFVEQNVTEGKMFYGLYGGLHLAPFGPLKPEQEKIIGSLKQYHFREIACNHCTGEPAVQKMLELGYPVRSGAGRDGSRSTLYTGNGERVEFPV